MINSRKRVSLVENFMSKTAIRTSTIPVIVCMCAKFLISRLKSHRPRSGSSLPRSGSAVFRSRSFCGGHWRCGRLQPRRVVWVMCLSSARPQLYLCELASVHRLPRAVSRPVGPFPPGHALPRAAPRGGREGGGTQPARCRTVHWARRPSSHLQRTERTAVRNMTQAWSGDRGHGQPYGGQHTHTTADCESWGCDETRPICTHLGPLGGHHQLPPSAPLEWRCIRRHQGSGVSATEAG